LCRVGPALRAEATAQARHSCRASPATIDGSCLGPVRQTRPIWPSIPLHGPRLCCCHLVPHPASFSLSPHASASAPPHSRQRAWEQAPLRRIRPTPAPTAPCSGYCTSTRTFHSKCAPLFSPSSDVPFIFPTFAMFFLPNLLPPPTDATVSGPTLVDVGTGRVGLALCLSLCVPPRRTW
jgi:hypothetical protein